METSRITLRQEDKTTTTVFANLSEVSTPIGSVLLLHDMAEHHNRFDDFIQILNQKGYDAYSFDQRGHGAGIRYEDLGFIAEENGHEFLITDALHVLKYIKKNNRGKKLILFGQGMGALVARCVIQAFDAIDACILCSSPNPPHKLINSQLTAAKFIKFRKKSRHQSVYMAKKLTEFKNFSKISNRTAFDWISRDNQLVGAYISDPLCGFTGTVSFYIDILNLTDEAVSRSNLKQIRNDLPILILSGSHDPMCDYGSDAEDIFDTFQHYKFSEVDCTIYEEARHDLLHETNSDEIIRDILEWLNKALDNRRLKAAALLKAKGKKKRGHSKNRTAAEAARSALGYASELEDGAGSGSIEADSVGDDDDFLEDMGYFSGRSTNSAEPEEEDEDFIIMDDDDEFDEFDEFDEADESEPNEDDSTSKNAKASSGKKGKKSDKSDAAAEQDGGKDSSDSKTVSKGKTSSGKSKKNNKSKK